ncbi:PREDICTED: nuclear pore complex protein NUP50A-like isoform X2 [Lupinus angustifolius]|uniref:nuclear pore complex protein NUP50A-like isoform X2 n=1 Tax=Lupinus angustifolius TaxID=3871 RepID=UPI00092EF247|nr:PREDICTED: nuclear pore complex protein NUP50A-like isoform X2 [Lupinus angustifolius]
MADAENALQSSKKRAAGRELTRDTPIDDEDDAPELETGTFKKASDDVLATRRIVKVRRQTTNSAPNPFAGIRLVAPTGSGANPAEGTSEAQGNDAIAKDTEETKGGENKQSESKSEVVENKSAANKEATEETNAGEEHTAENESTGDKSVVDKEQSQDVSKSENEDKKDTAQKSVDEVDKGQSTDDNVESGELSAEGGNLNSFQQLSSSKNAFTGLAGTGSSSPFSFGSVSNDKPFGLGLSTNGSSIFGTSGSSTVFKSEGSGITTLQEVVVETGEENEKVVFNADSILFEFVDGSWKEKGKGELKINVTSSGTEKARLLMRSKGNYRLILNARLYPDMKLTNMEKKGVTFACINSAIEDKGSLSTFALKFKDWSIVEEFKAAVLAHKGETKATAINIPENSPKATD